eukprot:gene14623-16212_t
MKKKATNNDGSKSNSGLSSSNRSNEIGFIPYFFFLSLSMLITFLLLMNNQDFFLSIFRSFSAKSGNEQTPVPVKLNVRVESSQESRERLFHNSPEVNISVSHPNNQPTKTSPPSPPSLPSLDERIDIIKNSRKCPAAISERYATIDESTLEEMRKNTKWCKDKIRMHGVKIGRSWGTLPRGDQQQWDSRKCNEILNLGTVQSCDERYGWKWFEKWLKNKKNVFESGSTVKCIQDYKTTSYCKMENVVLNFNQIQTHGGARGYSNGFLNFYGKQYEENKSFLPVYPGISSISDRRVPSPATQDCSKKETRPTFILSNDDIFNLGHYMNDVMGIWSMSVLANRAMNESLLINFDGYRYGGPAGGGAHRLMLNGKPDEHGPYSVEYYHKWFNNQVDQAKNYKGKVCFQELYIFPLPGVPWFWNEWGRDDECSMQAASPLYQSFNVYLRQVILDYHDQLKQLNEKEKAGKRLIFPSEMDYYHIIIERRTIKANNHNGHSSARFIKNVEELKSALGSIVLIHPETKKQLPIKVTAQDFSKLTFAEQIHLSHTASVLVSMHGAGTTHIFHMAVGDPKCCALMELFPDTSLDLYTMKGYGNLARMLGFYHDRYVTEKGHTRGDGSIVNAEKIKELTSNLLTKMVEEGGTCLHNVKDTRQPLYDATLAL